MASVVDICNLALSLIGGDNISSMSEASAQARAVNQFYAPARDELLGAYPWGFAQKVKALAQVVNDKAGTWGFAYELPVDMLRVGLLRPPYKQGMNIDEGQAAAADFAHHMEAGKIYSHMEQATLIYTGRVEDPNLYPPLFVNALAYCLAGWLAMPITRSVEIQGRMMQLAQRALNTAMAADADMNAHFDGANDNFIAARE